ncbi:MAG: hypothetical protein KKD31_04765 [Bacteroidetes bacterium]|nr:hypothetical protein [Bacteroidota bacterium]
MLIANPIYDAVFKYLMEDSKIARLLISGIIGENVILLDPKPQEYTIERKRKTGSESTDLSYTTVYKLDYTATIQTPDGTKKRVVIEVQKARLHTEIMRFREYLGGQYANPENVYEVREPEATYKKAMPIISIYFLGQRLNSTKAPVLKVARQYVDVINNIVLTEKEEFIESLTHDAFVIQIPYLKTRRKNELLRLLSVFDQNNITKDIHILNVKEESFPEKFRPIIRRLQKAIVAPEVRYRMNQQDRAEMVLLDQELKIEHLEKKVDVLEDSVINIEKTIEQKEKTIEQKEKTIEQKEKTIEQKDRLLAKSKKNLFETAKLLKSFGQNITEICKTTGLTRKQIEEL